MPNKPKALEVIPDLPNAALANANWADAFEVNTRSDFADMKALAQASVGSMPTWSRELLRLRNFLMRPFGLKPDGKSDVQRNDGIIDIFPILSETEREIVLGLDDRHLDFRIVLERRSTVPNERVRLTTLVRHHNMLGQCYLTAITPFHKAVVRSVLRQIA